MLGKELVFNMLDDVVLDKINTICIKYDLSSGARIFYIYLLLNSDFDNMYVFDDTAYICYLFGCSTRTLYNWVKDLCSVHLIKYDKKNIFVL